MGPYRRSMSDKISASYISDFQFENLKLPDKSSDFDLEHVPEDLHHDRIIN